MKRFAAIVSGLYLLILLALTVPVLRLAFGDSIDSDVFGVYLCWPYWLWLLVLVISQFVLLSVPVRVASMRPVTRRSLWLPIVACGLMSGGLAAGAGLAIYEFIMDGDNGSHWIFPAALGLLVLIWCLWCFVFWRIGRREEPHGLVTRQCRTLLRGSILELLIAVPTHIVVRSRDHCCGGFLTFAGLTMGIAVMLFSFGPAVFFLYADRWRRLHPRCVELESEPEG